MHTYEDKITGSCRERKITIKTRDGMAWPLENVTHTHVTVEFFFFSNVYVRFLVPIIIVRGRVTSQLAAVMLFQLKGIMQ